MTRSLKDCLVFNNGDLITTRPSNWAERQGIMHKLGFVEYQLDNGFVNVRYIDGTEEKRYQMQPTDLILIRRHHWYNKCLSKISKWLKKLVEYNDLIEKY